MNNITMSRVDLYIYFILVSNRYFFYKNGDISIARRAYYCKQGKYIELYFIGLKD